MKCFICWKYSTSDEFVWKLDSISSRSFPRSWHIRSLLSVTWLISEMLIAMSTTESLMTITVRLQNWLYIRYSCTVFLCRVRLSNWNLNCFVTLVTLWYCLYFPRSALVPKECFCRHFSCDFVETCRLDSRKNWHCFSSRILVVLASAHAAGVGTVLSHSRLMQLLYI